MTAQQRERRLILAIALALCAVPLCLAPLAGRSAKEIATERARYEARFSQVPTSNESDPQPMRDPFAGEETPPPLASATPAGGVRSTLLAPSLSVHAVVTGSAARALVEENGRIRIVEPGDALGNARVQVILSDGVRLSDGTLVRMSDTQQ